MFAAVLLWCWEPCTVLCRQTDGTMAGTEMTKCDDGTYIAGRRSPAAERGCSRRRSRRRQLAARLLTQYAHCVFCCVFRCSMVSGFVPAHALAHHRAPYRTASTGCIRATAIADAVLVRLSSDASIHLGFNCDRAFVDAYLPMVLPPPGTDHCPRVLLYGGIAHTIGRKPSWVVALVCFVCRGAASVLGTLHGSV